tara:strand:+ start:2083 stop:3132 length:1050 start_codon:yes stop_codon:yes gene_type:complete
MNNFNKFTFFTAIFIGSLSSYFLNNYINNNINSHFASADSIRYPYYDEFKDFIIKYNKSYTSTSEFWSKYHIYVENYGRINQTNLQGHRTFKLAMNQFGDLSTFQFRKYYYGLGNFSEHKYNNYSYKTFNSSKSIPDNLDWRSEGLVTNIKDQGQCGSCWAFSAVGTMEGAHAKADGNLVSLSEQNLVDCVTDDYGCGGGWPSDAIQYVIRNHGIDKESSYPYTAMDGGGCNFTVDGLGAKMSGLINVAPNDTQLLHAVAEIGPISVAIAAEDDFQFYSSGIFTSTDCEGADLDHAVLVVGYGISEKGHKYYIVKNSWGTSWGMDGYIYYSRDIPDMCGIASHTCYAEV